jgi:hypothetical protein
MRVLVACEFSGRVRDAFLARGHDAWSCDLERADHPNPNWRRHICGDVRPLLQEDGWDLVIAHPPCTYLSNAAVHLLLKEEGRKAMACDGAIFFLDCLLARAPRVCVENPTMHWYARELIPFPPTQVVQPYEHGDPWTKRTCLWLRGLPKLVPTRVVGKGQGDATTNRQGPLKEGRSLTFPGIARAMASQWG